MVNRLDPWSLFTEFLSCGWPYSGPLRSVGGAVFPHKVYSSANLEPKIGNVSFPAPKEGLKDPVFIKLGGRVSIPGSHLG